MSKSVYVLACLLLVLPKMGAGQSPTTSAKSDAEQAAVISSMATRVHYEDNGTGFVEESAVVRVQTSAGLERYGQLIFGYSSGTEDLEIDYVRVRKPGGETVETPASSAQDFAPEIIQGAPMYGDYRERHVTVVGLRPGDTLEYKITRHITTALAPNQFWYEYNFPQYVVVDEAKLILEFPQNRQVIIKSPKHKYTQEDRNGLRLYTWTGQNLKPPKLYEEDEDSDTEYTPDVQMTSFADWKQVAVWYAKLQGSQVVVDDAIRAKALELTRGATTDTEKAQRLYGYVAQQFRYVSLSFGVGRYQPHAAPEVLRASYGDCKDKHTLLSALLRAVDIPSYPVLIGAGRPLDPDVPSPAQFNHVITLVRLRNDLVWLDTTAEVAPFGLIVFPLRDQQALVAAEDDNGGLRKTIATSPVKSTLALNIAAKINELGYFDGEIEVTATGDNAVPLRAAFRHMTVDEWKQLAQRQFSRGGSSQMSDLKLEGLEDPSKPFVLRSHVHQEKAFSVPSPTSAYAPFPPMLFYISQTKPSAKPVRIGPTMEVTYRERLEFPANFTFNLPPQVDMTRDYADLLTTYHLTGNVLEIVQKLVIKKDELPPARLSDVLSLRGVVTNIAEQALTYSSRPASAEARQASVLPSGTDTETLHKAGKEALQQRDYQTAADLLKKVADQDPQNKVVWDELGRAYSGLDDHDKAIAAFQKQVEVDPFQKTAYVDLATELQQDGRTDEAIAAYRKQLENDSLDRSAHKSLGLLLLDARRDKEALIELQAAASIPPPDAEVQLALGQLYTRLGETEKAAPLLKRIVGSTMPFPDGDIFAAALRDDIDPEQSLRDARDILGDISDQFESGTYTELTPDASSAMQFVALEWARVGWAQFLQGDTLESLRFLNAAWMLSQSGTVANRLAKAYEKAQQPAEVKRTLALAVVAGGADVENSRAQLQKLDSAGSERDLLQAKADLDKLISIKLSSSSKLSGSAEYTLAFYSSSHPDVAVYRAGAADLRKAEQDVVAAKYPVLFPDQSSVKIIRSGKVSCAASGCLIYLKPLFTVAAENRAGTLRSR